MRYLMRLAVTATLAVTAGIGIATAAATMTATPAQAACSRSISTSGNADSVVITLHQTCGRAYRAIGFWGGGTVDGYHYGTYHVWPGGNSQFSTACGNSACTAGTVQWGGYERKTDGKIFCTYRCAAVHLTALVHRQACSGLIQWSYIGPSGFVWATRWHPNIDNCQQRSKVKCASRIGTTIIRYGGWVVPTDKWSGVNCTNSYPVFSEGGVQTRPFAGAPLVQNKWLFSLTRGSR